MDFLLRLVLAVCPADFRERHSREIIADAHAPNILEIMDVLTAGLILREQLLLRNIRLAARTLYRTPLATSVAIVAITIGLGANITGAALVNTLLIHPLPYSQPQQLLLAENDNSGINYSAADKFMKTVAPYADAGFSESDDRVWSRQAAPVKLQGAVVSRNYFDVLRVQPSLGLFFNTRKSTSGEIVVSYDFWKQFFEGRNALEGTVDLDHQPFKIIGVAPRGFHGLPQFGIKTSYWIPINPHDDLQTSARNESFFSVARVHGGIDVGLAAHSATLALDRILKESNRRLPAESCCVQVLPATEILVPAVKPLVLSLYLATLILLIITCVNVASLQVARNAARTVSIATRVALGATHLQIAYELTIEVALISVIGCVLGLAMADITLKIMAHLLPTLEDVTLSGPVIEYSIALIFTTTAVIAILPSISRREADISMLIKGAGHGSQGITTRRTLSVLVVSEVAFAAALVTCCGLLVRSYVSLSSMPLGFTPAGVYVAEVQQPSEARINWSSATQRSSTSRFAVSTLENLKSLPGLKYLAYASQLPFACCTSQLFRVNTNAPGFLALSSSVTSDYFKTVRIPLISGRYFTDEDRSGTDRVAIIDEAFARQHFGSDDVIGRSLMGDNRLTIVGLVGSVRQLYGSPPKPTVYVPFFQSPRLSYLVIQTSTKIPRLTEFTDKAFAEADSSLPSPHLDTFDHLMNEQFLPPLIGTEVVLIFAALALILALAGIFAAAAFSVERRSQEFGIRKALGATFSRIVRIAVGSILNLVVLGMLIGIVLTALLSQALTGILYVDFTGGLFVYATTISIFVLSACVAALIPAARAASVSPSIALRNE